MKPSQRIIVPAATGRSTLLRPLDPRRPRTEPHSPLSLRPGKPSTLPHAPPIP
jgi:hypothetical protein